MLGMRGPFQGILKPWFLLGASVLLLCILTRVRGGPLELRCDPCIDRNQLEIHAIVYGNSSDPTWQRTKQAMRQTAEDMGIQFTLKLSDNFSSTQMAKEIRRLIRFELDDSEHGHTHDVKQIDGLIVSIPDETVKAAVEEAIESGIHVFGFDLGYQYSRELGVMGYVAQDEFLAGQSAAREFERRRPDDYGPAQTALFVNHDENDLALTERFRGFNDTLFRLGVATEQVVVDPSNEYAMAVELYGIISPCDYDYVLLGGWETVKVAELIHDDCNSSPDDRVPILVAAFDGTEEVFNAIATKSIEFALTQENYLRGAMPVILSTLYASTGKYLASPFDQPIYSSGPRLVDVENFPSGEDLACRLEAFPVCNWTGGSDESGKCPCTDRRDHKIAGIVHGAQGDELWETIINAATQASIDMNIELEVELFQPRPNKDTSHREMASRIEDICAGGIAGIFVSIPSDAVAEAVRFCKQLKIPVINVNQGHRYARQLDVQHVGQLDSVAGVLAGQRMALANVKEGYCIIPDSSNAAFVERCDGFEAALLKEGRDYGGIIEVSPDNRTAYGRIIESAIGDLDGNWDGKGLLVLGDIRPALQVQRRHQRVALGTFDLTKNLYKPLDDGRLLFTIDQQPYLQGSMSVYLLAYAALTEQTLVNDVIETGPRLVQYSPDEDQLMCEETGYMVCPQIPEEDYNLIPESWLIWGKIGFGLVGLVSLISLLWMFVCANNKVVQASQLIFLVALVAGAIISMSAIIPHGKQTIYRYMQDPATGEVTDEINPGVAPVDTACMLSPWLYGVGFSIMFSALCTKIHRLKLIQAGGTHAKQVGFLDFVITVATNLILESAILVCWTLISPSQWERMSTEIKDGYVIESVGQCSSEYHDTFLLAQLIFHAVCLFYAMLLSWQASETLSEFSEGSYIFLSVLVMFQVVALSIPISFVLEERPDHYYLFWGVFLFLQSFPLLCLIFIPKMVIVSTGNDSSPFPATGRTVQGNAGGHDTNFQFQTGNSASTPAAPMSYSSNHSLSAPNNLSIDESLRRNGDASRLNSSSSSSNYDYSPRVVSGKGKGGFSEQERGPVARMPPIESGSDSSDSNNADSDEESERDAVVEATIDGVRNHLKVGLDSDDFSTSSLGSAPETSQSNIAHSELAGLASEISKAEQKREKLYSSGIGDDNLITAAKEQAPTAADAKVDNSEPTAEPNGESKRQSSLDMDDNVSSSSNDSYYVPKRPLVLSKMPRTNALPDPSPRSVIAEESKTKPESSKSAVASDRQEEQINPQEGPQGSLGPGKNKKEKLALASENLNESGSSGLDANTTGITKAEASKAEIFRKTSPMEQTSTPIRLKKQAQAYGENATLAMGITKTSGSFLRKVAQSFGSASMEAPPQHLASSGSRSTNLDTPTRPKSTSKIESLLDGKSSPRVGYEGDVTVVRDKKASLEEANYFL